MEGYRRMKECHNNVSGINEALKRWSKMKTGNINDRAYPAVSFGSALNIT